MSHILVILVLLALWVVVVFVSPTKACRRCAQHRGPCQRCKGTGRVPRIGAQPAHRAALSLWRAWRDRGES